MRQRRDETFDQRIGADQAAVEIDDQRLLIASLCLLLRREGRRAHPNASLIGALGVPGAPVTYRRIFLRNRGAALVCGGPRLVTRVDLLLGFPSGPDRGSWGFEASVSKGGGG